MTKDVIELNEKNFDSEVAKGKWIVDFWAEWCIPCRIMAPHFEQAAKELKGKVKFGKVNVDQQMQLAERFQIVSIPTTIYFKDKEQVNRVSGAVPKDQLMEEIDKSF